jgi:hypothetical protein
MCALGVLFELIARNDPESAIQGAIRARQSIARHEDDHALARWLDDAALRIDFLKRNFDEHMAADQLRFDEIAAAVEAP